MGSPISQLKSEAASMTSGSIVVAVDGKQHDDVETLYTDTREGWQHYMQMVNSWLNMAEPLIHQGNHTMETLWRTMTGDNEGRIFPAAQGYRTNCKAISRSGTHKITVTLRLFQPRRLNLGGQANPLFPSHINVYSTTP